ncbi:hypothetical protein DMENIID0001_139500 [Sergentomyia squamirostris]
MITLGLGVCGAWGEDDNRIRQNFLLSNIETRRTGSEHDKRVLLYTTGASDAPARSDVIAATHNVTEQINHHICGDWLHDITLNHLPGGREIPNRTYDGIRSHSGALHLPTHSLVVPPGEYTPGTVRRPHINHIHHIIVLTENIE